MGDSLTKQRTDGALARIITPVYGNEIEDGRSKIVHRMSKMEDRSMQSTIAIEIPRDIIHAVRMKPFEWKA